jgi:hypothetical protein
VNNPRVLAVVGCVLALLLGRHLLPDFLLGFTITLGLSLAAVSMKIAVIIAETGWRIQPVRRTAW